MCSNALNAIMHGWLCTNCLILEEFTQDCHSQRKFLHVYFGGLLFTSHWLNLQHWTDFYKSMGIFRGSFLFSRALLCISGSFRVKIPRSPHVFFIPGHSLNSTFLVELQRLFKRVTKDESGSHGSKQQVSKGCHCYNQKYTSPPPPPPLLTHTQIACVYICALVWMLKFNGK